MKDNTQNLKELMSLIVQEIELQEITRAPMRIVVNPSLQKEILKHTFLYIEMRSLSSVELMTATKGTSTSVG
jgi:hypothetical protein